MKERDRGVSREIQKGIARESHSEVVQVEFVGEEIDMVIEGLYLEKEREKGDRERVIVT